MRKIFVLLILVSLLASGLAFAVDESVGDDPIHGEAEVHQEEGNPMGTPYEAFWTILSFLVLIIVLWRFAWKPMLASLQSREDFIAKQISDAEDTRKKAEDVLAEYHGKLADADMEGKGIIARHAKTAEKESREAVDLTKKELEGLRAKLKAEVAYERQEAESQFWDQAGDIVLELGKEVLGKSMQASDHDKLIDEAIVRLKAEETQQAKLEQE
jgi:F-type H+-transporting ATPase subunit b